MASPSALMQLPTEIHLIIASFLEPAEKQLFRMCCRTFHLLLPPPTFHDFHHIDQSPYNRYRFTLCTACRKLQPQSNWVFQGDMFMCRKCRWPMMTYHGDSEKEFNEMRWKRGSRSMKEISTGIVTATCWGWTSEKMVKWREQLRKLRREQGLDERKWELASVDVCRSFKLRKAEAPFRARSLKCV